MTEELSLSKPQAVHMRIDEVVPDPSQPRETMPVDSLKSLAESIIGAGQINPIVVRPGPEGKYMIVTGERRWRAAREAGLTEIDCVIRCDVDDQKALEMQLTENSQREDIPPLEQAKAYKSYLEKYKVSQYELSRRTGIPQRTISDRLTLLSLAVSVHANLERGNIGPYEAVKIAALPPDNQEAVAEAVASGKVAGRMLEKLFQQIRAQPEKPLDVITSELLSPQSPLPSAVNTTDVAIPAPVTAVSSTNSHPGNANSEEKEGIDLENKLALIKLLSEIRKFLNIATKVGSERQECCPNMNKERLCNMWCWEEEGVRKWVGELVNHDGHWYVRPSPLQCAVCTNDLLFQVVDLELEVEANPASGLRREFKCNCGSSGEVAVAVKCTRCGKETHWGWWPEKS